MLAEIGLRIIVVKIGRSVGSVGVPLHEVSASSSDDESETGAFLMS